MYFNSQSLEVIELPVLSCMHPPDLLNVWLEDETKPKLFHLKAATPPSQHPFTPKRFELHTPLSLESTPRIAVTKPLLYYSRVPVLQNRNELELRLFALLPTPKDHCYPSPMQLARFQFSTLHPAGSSIMRGSGSKMLSGAFASVLLSGRSPAPWHPASRAIQLCPYVCLSFCHKGQKIKKVPRGRTWPGAADHFFPPRSVLSYPPDSAASQSLTR